MLQKAKNSNTQIMPKKGRTINMKKVFRKINEDGDMDDDEQDENADLEAKIKCVFYYNYSVILSVLVMLHIKVNLL